MTTAAPEHDATVELRTIPSADRGFALHVAGIAERESFATPIALEDRLRRLYPTVRVRSRDLSGEDPCWYVYRDGRWTGWPVVAWWHERGLPRFGVSVAGRIQSATRAAAALVHVRTSEIVGRDVRTVLTADPDDVGALLRAIRSAGQWNAFVRVRSSDGRHQVCEAHAEATTAGMVLVLKPDEGAAHDQPGGASHRTPAASTNGRNDGTTAERLAPVLTIAEAARATSRNPELLRRWCSSGRVRARRRGRDWILDRGEIERIEAMPRRRVNDERARIRLDDLEVLRPSLRAEVEDCLGDGETVRVVVAGVEDSGLVATNRRVFIARDGVLVTDPENGEPAAWPLSDLRRVQLEVTSALGALVVTPVDVDHRALVVVLARPHLARAQAAASALRDLLQAARES